METASVRAIKERNVKEGEGKRGHWSMDRVILDTGEEVNIFSPIEVGDVVESYENNGYTNWRLKDGAQEGSGRADKGTSASGGITTDRLLVELLQLTKLVKEILDRQKVLMGEEPETPEVVEEVETKRADRSAAAAPDVVLEDIDAPINLDDIPF